MHDLLSEKAQKLWQDYLEGVERRSRKQSLGVLNRFLSAIRQVEPAKRRQLALYLCEESIDREKNLPIREPLFDNLIFPELLQLYQEGDQKVSRYLASFHNFILKSERLMQTLEEVGLSQIELLKAAVKADPADRQSVEQLLSLWEQWFDYCVAQAPETIRFKGAPADDQQKAYLLDELNAFEKIMRQYQEEDRFEKDLKIWRQLISDYQPL